MFKSLKLFLMVVVVAGCDATSDNSIAIQQMRGQLRIDPALDNADYDYVLTFSTLRDFNFDNRKEADRRRYVASVLQRQCGAVRIVDEIETVTGRFANGDDVIMYTVMVKCI